MCPQPNQVLEALKLTAPKDGKVVIIGQDPYINGEAHGLAFSSQAGVTPSLQVIFEELARCGYPRTNPDLTSWAEQGVLLLNTILTTQRGLSLAHDDYGWEDFTASVLKHVAYSEEPLVVMTWGSVARNFYTKAIPKKPPNILHLDAVHPVAQHRKPSEYRFVGCNHFVQANEWLAAHHKQPITWNK